MRATPARELPEPTACAGGCRYEPKFDGWRALVFVDRQVFVQSRSGRPLHRYFPDIAGLAAAHLERGVVLDGELVVWDAAAGRTSFEALQGRVTAGRGLPAEAAAWPAHLVCFDLLHDPGGPLLDQPLTRRRARLETLLAGAPTGLQLCPHTADLDQARQWLADLPATGVEGVVVKAAAGRWRPGETGWIKVKTRTTTEAIVAGVTGALTDPTSLLLGRPGPDGRLRYVGRTHRLPAGRRHELAGLLQPAGPGHPWPCPLPAGWAGRFTGRQPVPYLPVTPLVVVEVEADVAYEAGRWRHLVGLIRPRPDLTVEDIPTAGR